MQFQPAAPLAILCLWFLNVLNTLRAQWVPQIPVAAAEEMLMQKAFA
jgi:hypothetical protein